MENCTENWVKRHSCNKVKSYYVYDVKENKKTYINKYIQIYITIGHAYCHTIHIHINKNITKHMYNACPKYISVYMLAYTTRSL